MAADVTAISGEQKTLLIILFLPFLQMACQGGGLGSWRFERRMSCTQQTHAALKTHTHTPTHANTIPCFSVTAPSLSYKRLVIVLQQWQCKCLSVTIPLLIKSVLSLIHRCLWGIISWTLTTISYLEDVIYVLYYYYCWKPSALAPCWICPSLIFKSVLAADINIYFLIFQPLQGVTYSFISPPTPFLSCVLQTCWNMHFSMSIY